MARVSLLYRQWPLSGLWVIGLFVGIDLIFNGWGWVMLGTGLRRIGTSEETLATPPLVATPSRIIESDLEEMTVDGVFMIQQNTPGTEAPSEMNTYFPDRKALWMAENVVASLHNIYTLRGTLVRDPLRSFRAGRGDGPRPEGR